MTDALELIRDEIVAYICVAKQAPDQVTAEFCYHIRCLLEMTRNEIAAMGREASWLGDTDLSQLPCMCQNPTSDSVDIDILKAARAHHEDKVSYLKARFVTHYQAVLADNPPADWVRWVATNDNGEIWYYESKPEYGTGFWDAHAAYRKGLAALSERYGLHASETLFEIHK